MMKKKHKKSGNIEIVMGDNSTLEISDVGDCMNDLRPKKNKKKKIVIPKVKRNKDEI